MKFKNSNFYILIFFFILLLDSSCSSNKKLGSFKSNKMFEYVKNQKFEFIPETQTNDSFSKNKTYLDFKNKRVEIQGQLIKSYDSFEIINLNSNKALLISSTYTVNINEKTDYGKKIYELEFIDSINQINCKVFYGINLNKEIDKGILKSMNKNFR